MPTLLCIKDPQGFLYSAKDAISKTSPSVLKDIGRAVPGMPFSQREYTQLSPSFCRISTARLLTECIMGWAGWGPCLTLPLSFS